MNLVKFCGLQKRQDSPVLYCVMKTSLNVTVTRLTPEILDVFQPELRYENCKKSSLRGEVHVDGMVPFKF